MGGNDIFLYPYFRPYLFSNSLPPPVVASASQVFSMLLEDSSLVERIISNTAR
jgi:7-keto-8-aminopelargonate synthetase-like enzyme